jgi:hypothetical protein
MDFFYGHTPATQGWSHPNPIYCGIGLTFPSPKPTPAPVKMISPAFISRKTT